MLPFYDGFENGTSLNYIFIHTDIIVIRLEDNEDSKTNICTNIGCMGK